MIYICLLSVQHEQGHFRSRTDTQDRTCRSGTARHIDVHFPATVQPSVIGKFPIVNPYQRIELPEMYIRKLHHPHRCISETLTVRIHYVSKQEWNNLYASHY